MQNIRHKNSSIPARLSRITRNRDGWTFATATLPSGRRVQVSRRPGCRTWSTRR